MNYVANYLAKVKEAIDLVDDLRQRNRNIGNARLGTRV